MLDWTAIAVLAVLTLLALVGFFAGSRLLRAVTLTGAVAYLGFYLGSCPDVFGHLQSLLQHSLGPGEWVLPAVAVGLAIIPALLVGNLFCGWICPKGAIQEFLFRDRLSFRVPARIDRWLGWARYASMAVFLAAPAFFAARLFCSIDPFRPLFNLMGETTLVVAMALTMVLSLVVYRPFCRYFCPLGGLLGLLARFGLGRARFGAGCTGCGVAEKKCPTGALTCAEPATGGEGGIDATRCFGCLECTAACRRDALHLTGKAISSSAPDRGEPAR